jgi:hypothetical protein
VTDRSPRKPPRPAGDRPPFVVDLASLLARLALSARRILLVGLALSRRMFRPGAAALLRFGPLVLAALLIVYAALVLRAAVTLSSLLWLGNGVFTVALAGLGLHGLLGRLERHGLGLAARDVAGELGAAAPTELWVVAADGTRQMLHPLDRRMFLVGRGPVCDVRIQEETVSRRHCRIVRRSGVYRVEDLESTYGTLLNGRRLSPEGAVLERGDVIGFSSTGGPATTLFLGPAPDGAGRSGVKSGDDA